MTQAEFFETAGYFANPVRNPRIEIEARQKDINSYAPTYLTKTGQPLPIGNDAVYSLPNTANKWGREMRLYFTRPDGSVIPTAIAGLETGGGRPGYDRWSHRLNNRDIIDELFDYGFAIGEPQDEVSIRANIPVAHAVDFNRGYNMP